MRDPRRVGAFALCLLLTVSSLAFVALWIEWDTHLPDGDEAGHLGAIELYRDVALDRGYLASARDAFSSPSEYPPLYALAIGLPMAALHAAGPFPAGVGWVQGAWLALAVPLVFGLARALSERAQPSLDPALRPWLALFAAAAFVTFPLLSGLSRHAMPEPFLTLWVTATLWAALETDGFRRTLPTILLGLATAGGLLTKQTFVLYVAGPLTLLALSALRTAPGPASRRLALFVALAAPLPALWVVTHWTSQQAYALQSSAEKARVSVVDALAYYPAVLAGTGVGLLWTVPLLLAIVLLAARRRWMPLLWLAAVLLTLTVMPKKYPRLIVPALPLVAATLAMGLAELRGRALRRTVMAVGVGAGAVQCAALALPVGLPPRLGLWEPALLQRVDPGCPQDWIRRPAQEDLGFDRLLEVTRGAARRTLEGGPGTTGVAFLREPEVPCEFETTFGYAYHFAEYARRRGIEVSEAPLRCDASTSAEGSPCRPAAVVVHTQPWCEPAGEASCDQRDAFEPAGHFAVEAGTLRFTLYVYRRL